MTLARGALVRNPIKAELKVGGKTSTFHDAGQALQIGQQILASNSYCEMLQVGRK